MAKTRSDEDFLVGSLLIRSDLRQKVAEFYRFARTADDIADNPDLSKDEKLKILAEMEDKAPDRHAVELLKAFRMDAEGYDYNTWQDLMDYCRYSAVPVGEFMLDIHNEPFMLYHPSRAMCVILQVLNHLQDRQKDFNLLHRVYIKDENVEEFIRNTEALFTEAVNVRKIYNPRLRLEISIIYELAVRHLKRIKQGRRLNKIDWIIATIKGIAKGIVRK